ncbi:MFS transporter [Allokutzneria sp. A3M-2-11 16]|uniref:MFS transporter n=1 Tax=Allokutzneria sp. A3M-2-11 16 TaxID=2962043 RepID=UPI0020B6F7C0|nr:MFS transporter [Allokutzneria sp. A3M-2-11 16]MCP3804332.1 MFS transporter [Allokutzneria sp. A3M-2-11 16]
MVVDIQPLSRNRNYTILWTSQLFSELAGEITQIAFPLLILLSAGSPLEVGVIGSVLAFAHMIAIVPAGVMADRWNRKRVMLVCQIARTAAMAALAFTLAFDARSFLLLVVVALVEGFLGSVFDPAEHAALPQVVPAEQLSQAIATNTARPFIATLAGPVIAGVLFGAHPMLPFLAQAAVLGISVVALVFLRLPPRAPAPPEAVSADLLGGFRWVLGQRVIRSTLVWMMCSNLLFSALLVVILAISGEDSVAPGEIGFMMAFLGAGGLLGGLFAARLHAAFRAPVLILGFSWIAAALTAVMAFVPAGVPLGLLLGGAAFLLPVANTTVMTYQMMITPDELRGRLSGVAGFCSGGAGALGPLVGGALTAALGGTPAVLLCAAAMACVALATTLSPTMRRFPSASPQ